MPAFPTLSVNPFYPIDEEREDCVIKNDFEFGYVLTRPRFTRMRRKFTLNYQYMTSTDKTSLDDFIVTVAGGSDYFSWINPVNDQTYTVRFDKPPKFAYIGKNYWNAELTLVEV